jgi:MoxR-like ATPase
MLKVLVGYPSATEEYVVVERMIRAAERIDAVLNADGLRGLQAAVDTVYVDPGVIQYAVALAGATRDPGVVGLPELARYLSFGASPRASINIVLAARALAYLRGRDYVIPMDARELAPDVLRHRMVLSYEALADDVSADDLLGPILAAVPLPETAGGRHTPGVAEPIPANVDPAWYRRPE